MSTDRTVIYPECQEPMKWMRVLPAAGLAWAPLWECYCEPCGRADTQEGLVSKMPAITEEAGRATVYASRIDWGALS
jgi:hypothetical protein